MDVMLLHIREYPVLAGIRHGPSAKPMIMYINDRACGGHLFLKWLCPGRGKCTLHIKNADGRFHAAEKDADILIYNGTIEGELISIDELVQKNSLFADFKQ